MVFPGRHSPHRNRNLNHQPLLRLPPFPSQLRELPPWIPRPILPKCNLRCNLRCNNTIYNSSISSSNNSSSSLILKTNLDLHHNLNNLIPNSCHPLNTNNRSNASHNRPNFLHSPI